jgi:hypothetical protein
MPAELPQSLSVPVIVRTTGSQTDKGGILLNQRNKIHFDALEIIESAVGFRTQVKKNEPVGLS